MESRRDSKIDANTNRPLGRWLHNAPILADDTPPLAKAPFTSKQAGEFQQRSPKHIGKPVVYANSIGMKMMLLPPGEFTIGRAEEQFDELLEVVDADPEMKKNRGGQGTVAGRC